MCRSWLLAIAATVLLSADSCHNPQRLWQQYQAGDYSFQTLFKLSSQSSLYQQAALDSLTSQAVLTRQHYWLQTAEQLGSAQASYHLALHTSNKAEKQRLMHRAAKGGVVAAQISLYQHYMGKNSAKSAKKAEKWLQIAANHDAKSALLWGKALWRKRHFVDAEQTFTSAVELGNSEAIAYQKLASQVLVQGWPVRISLPSRTHCAMHLRLIADTFESVMQAQQFAHQFHSDVRLQSLPVCLEELSWLPQGQLLCTAKSSENHRISCDIAKIADDFANSKATHGVIFSLQGKAYVHNGLMFLDRTDTYSVFVHELAHFAGFLDEYPLSASLAERICNGKGQANLVILPQGHRQTDLSPSRTCDNHPHQAYKLSDKMTFMEYHDQQQIPLRYLRIWRQQLADTQQLTPAYVNFSQYFADQNKTQQAEYWWQRYQAFRSGASPGS